MSAYTSAARHAAKCGVRSNSECGIDNVKTTECTNQN